jgi:hypothetical protein
MLFKIFYGSTFVLISLFLSCKKNSSETNVPCTIQPDSVAIAAKLLPLSDAEKIMGEPAKLTCNSFIKKIDTMEYTCDYTAVSQDQLTRKTGKLYFMYEIYGGVAAAQNAYAGIYQANRMHAGVEVVSGLGDEAYYHSDRRNFYFFLVRKNEKMIRLKLNKVTSHSSEVEFKRITKLVVDRI